MEEEKKKRRKTKGMKGTGGSNSKTTGAEIGKTMTISVAEKANAFSAGNNRTCSNGGSRKDEHGNDMAAAEDRVSIMQPICHGGRQGEKLLHLWRIWAHGLSL